MHGILGGLVPKVVNERVSKALICWLRNDNFLLGYWLEKLLQVVVCLYQHFFLFVVWFRVAPPTVGVWAGRLLLLVVRVTVGGVGGWLFG